MNEETKQINELSARILQLEKDKQELNERLAERTNAFLQAEARHIQRLRDAQDSINKSLLLGGKDGKRVLIRYKQRVGEME